MAEGSISEKLRLIRARIVVPMHEAQLALLSNDLDPEKAIQWLKERGCGGTA